MVCLNDIQMKPGMLIVQIQSNQQAKYHKDSEIPTCSLGICNVGPVRLMIVVNRHCQSLWRWIASGLTAHGTPVTMKN